jgi:hypothetical protein
MNGVRCRGLDGGRRDTNIANPITPDASLSEPDSRTARATARHQEIEV